MASLLKRFEKEISGRKKEVIDFIPEIDANGDFKKVRGIEAIIKSWTNILLTPLGTYDHDPDYGSKLLFLVFEPADEITREKIYNEIDFRLPRFDDRAQIDDIDVQFFNNRKGFTVTITVNYDGDTGILTQSITEQTASKFLEA